MMTDNRFRHASLALSSCAQPARSRSIHPLFALATLLTLIILTARPTQAQPPDHTLALPIILAPPGSLIVADEAALRAAIATANVAGQLPRIELIADIALTGPLPTLDNPHAGTATIAGNAHTIDGNRLASVLAVGPGTSVVVENLTITGGSGSSGANGDCGGGVYSEGHLTLRHVRLEDNWARRGGGICVYSPTSTPASLHLEDAILDDNAAFMTGGGVYVDSEKADVQVNISRSLLQANAAQNSGGGIYSFATAGTILSLNIEDTTLTGNNVVNYVGGALLSATYEGSISTVIRRSTISGNTAPAAAGFFHEGSSEGGGQAQAIVMNSTFSGNISYGSGGAISNVDFDPLLPLSMRPGGRSYDINTPSLVAPFATIGGAHLQLLYSTVTANRANRGSGIWNDGWLRATGSIVAGNEAAGRDCWQPIRTGGYNLDGDGTCGLIEPSDLPLAHPDLLPLAVVAPGTTATHALGPNSQALDRIPLGEFGCDPPDDTDQRGVTRPQPPGGMCDIGAYEAAAP